jgi:iron complex outermembrane receptor protein
VKKIITCILLAHLTLVTQAQIKTSSVTGDSARFVELSELIVRTRQKTAEQRLVNFFRVNNAATLEDILSRLPEVSLLRRGSYGMEPAIRSFSGGQINVMVDGMRIHGACTDKMDPATIYIEPINLDNLQVQTGSSGFVNGSAIGGTVNMKMAEPDYLSNNKVTGMISSGYQSAAKSIYESARLNYSSAIIKIIEAAVEK